MSGLGHVMAAVALTAQWDEYRDRPAPDETMTAFKKRRRAWKRAVQRQSAGAVDGSGEGLAGGKAEPVAPIFATLLEGGRAGPTSARLVKSGVVTGSGPASVGPSGHHYTGQAARLREALPNTLRSLMDRGRVSEAMATAAARFMIDYRTGYLPGGSVAYGIRVQGGGGWSEGRALSGQAARRRVEDAKAAMGPKPAACVKAVLIDGVTLSAAGEVSGYDRKDQRRSYAVGLLETGLDELVRFYA